MTNDNKPVSYKELKYVHDKLKSEIDGIEIGTQVNTVIGVKGNAENNYRTGEINISPADIGLGNVDNTSDADKPISTAMQAALDGKISTSAKGANGGIAELDVNGKVPSSQLPSYVDDVLEYASKSNFPATGETGKIYVDTTTNLTYRWSGSAYTEISPSLALGETSSTAYRGDRGAVGYAHAVTNKGSAYASGLYKITTNSEGHVTVATAVTKSDITALGIPASDTDTTYSAGTGLSLSGTTFSNSAPNVKSDWNATAGTDAEILNKPTLGGAAAKDVGTGSNQVAAGNHNHSGVYAPKSHAHATVLYTGDWSTHSSSSIVLSSEVSNFDFIEIFFSCTLSSNIHSSVRIIDNKKPVLSITDISSSEVGVYSAVLTIGNDGKTITSDKAYAASIKSSGVTITNKKTDTSSSVGRISVYKVVGYSLLGS